MQTVIWRIRDGKPGHENQTLGLVNALRDLTPIETFDLPAPRRSQCLQWWFAKKFPPGNLLPPPQLILGAGHSTHLTVLAARRRFGGKAVVLMKPSLPYWLFDLSIVPRHDGPAEAANVVLTRGVLNLVAPSQKQEPGQGLILIGGPSSAYGWSNPSILEQIDAVVSSQLMVKWNLTTSRRTPTEFLKLLKAQQRPNLTVVPQKETGPNWVPNQLASASQVWVSEDSVSMVYEALTSGARVGLLEVPRIRSGRVARGVQELKDMGWITRFADWNRGGPLPSPKHQLHESARCAGLIVERFRLPQAA